MERNTSRRWRAFKRTFKARCKAANKPCHICRQPIDYDAPPQTPDAFEVDHIIPVSVSPGLELVPSNAAASHCRCNRQRKASKVDTTWVRPSW